MSTTTFREDPDRRALTRAWLHQLDPFLAVFDQIVDSRMPLTPDGDRRPRCESWSDTSTRLCPELARDDTRFCRMHQPRPVCTGTTAGTGTFSKTAPRPCKAPAMKGYSACCRHVEGEEKARYDREQAELARAEAKKDAARAERKRKRQESIASDRAGYLAGAMPDFFEVMPAPFEALGFRIGTMYLRETDIVCELCHDDSQGGSGRANKQWAEDHLRECPVSS